MEKRDIRKMMRDAADYNELQTIITAANEEIKRRQETRKGEFKKAINDAIYAAHEAGFKITINNENSTWTFDPYDTIELR